MRAPVSEARFRRRDLDLAPLAVQQHPFALRSWNVSETDDHRHPSSARERGDVTRRAARLQRDAGAARPVNLQEARRREVVGDENCSVRQHWGRIRFSRERTGHTVTNIDEIGRPGSEILVVRRLIVRDLCVERPRPCLSGWRPNADFGERGRAQILVLQQRELEFEDLGGLARLRASERPELRGGVRYRLL